MNWREKGEPMSDRDTIERAIRHIDSCLDVDPWARDIAIDAMKAQLSGEDTTSDCISRQVAIDAVENCEPGEELFMIKSLPSVQPEPSEITDEQAILHLQSTGWMQNHDREMYESGLREQLADDSGSYDSLIPCEDTINRQDAIDVASRGCFELRGVFGDVKKEIEALPSAQSELKWIPCSEKLPERGVSVLISHVGFVSEDYLDIDDDGELYFWNSGLCLEDERQNIAWMPLPSAWKGENNG